VIAAHGFTSSARLPDSGLRALFSLDARRQRYLDVEAALAATQAEQGLVPAVAADAIAAHARLELLDEDRLAAEEARTGHVMVPIISDLLVGVLTDLADLADRYADTVMAGRTHAQQAVGQPRPHGRRDHG
jgi:adenylosuccinate lyase